MHCTELKMRRELERARGQYPKAVHGRTVAGMPERDVAAELGAS